MEFIDGPIGTLWTEKNFPKDIVDDAYQQLNVSRAIDLLSKTPSRSIIISGDRGTGKSTIINLVSKELKLKKWEILVAGAMDINAGQMYVGMLDEQIKNLVAGLSKKKKNLWVIPEFHELYYSGRSMQDPTGILDRILPFIERSNITILAESNAVELERILKLRPQLRTLMEVIRLEPLPQTDTLNLAAKWVRMSNNSEIWNNVSEKDLHEAFTFSGQFVRFSKEPGNFFSFLKLTQSIVEATKKDDKTGRKITTDDFIHTVSALSGLPLSIIDDRQKLDIEALRKQFYKRIIGQEEAVEAIVERIAMIKAGFTDAARPLGIFLFVGPTGTGKTEIAKTLAEFLFGSGDRMIRIDMSEFQTPDSLSKLIGSSGDTESVALVDQIRKNPFSVVLLDEFEKANPNVWDLFLQLFDDARLTDSGGNTADFRHAIIIMTSNLGSGIPTDQGIGFGKNVGGSFDPKTITKSLYKTFKPEFINRIDRVITFNPLSKATMRLILKNELNKVLQRRGFRQRQWAVEWDESAIEFLLEKGFSRELGARPVKRAIEQYLLSPLAITIVTHQFPKGDQFLFISRSDNNLKADFIDPDAPGVDWKEQKEIAEAQHEKAKTLTLKKIALDPQGIIAEIEVLQNEFNKLHEQTEAKQWRDRKEDLMLKMNEPGFWSNNDRKKYLSEFEYRDRFAQSLLSVASILERFSDLKKKHSNFHVELIEQVAERLYLMQVSLEAFEKNIAQDAVIKVTYEPSGSEAGNEKAHDFWEKLSHMYVQWAKKRKMTYQIITQNVFADHCEFIMTVEGFAAFQVIEKEKGIHIWEEVKKENKIERKKLRVDVRILPEEIFNKEPFQDVVKKVFDLPASDLTRITRKYRHKPSPLVRDEVAGWRTGKLDKILEGDFDLIE